MRPSSRPVPLIDSSDVLVHVLLARGPVGIGFPWCRAFLRPGLGQKAEPLSASGVKMSATETSVAANRDAGSIQRLVLAQLAFLRSES